MQCKVQYVGVGSGRGGKSLGNISFKAPEMVCSRDERYETMDVYQRSYFFPEIR